MVPICTNTKAAIITKGQKFPILCKATIRGASIDPKRLNIIVSPTPEFLKVVGNNSPVNKYIAGSDTYIILSVQKKS